MEIADLLPNDSAAGIWELPGLQDMYSTTSPYYDYIEAVKTSFPQNAEVAGVLRERLRALWTQAGVKMMADYVFTQPGGRRVRFGDRTYTKRENPLPIAYDIWYLFEAGNMLDKGKPDDYEEDEWREKVLDDYLETYMHEVDDSDTLKPLKQPTKEDLRATSGPLFTTIVKPDMDGVPFVIKEARFETMVKADGGTPYPVLGVFKINDEPYWPPKEGLYDATDVPPDPLYGLKEPDSEPYCGYIAFPVGPTGVMWRISIATESSLGSGSLSGTDIGMVHPADEDAKVQLGQELLPPFDINRDENAGTLLFEKGYLVSDNSTVELVPEKFDDVDNPELHSWLRYWIKADNTMIIPGEFVGLICRSWPLHAWWYQESSPFLYAGTWLETEFYTSGVVKCVLEPWTDPDTDPPTRGENDTLAYYDPDEDNFDFSVGSNLYVVWVKNEEIIVSSSDFKEYEVDTRVGLLKCVRDGDATSHVNTGGSYDALAGTGDTFSWESLKWFVLKGKSTPDKDIFTMEWVVVPVDFFETAGNSVGGV